MQGVTGSSPVVSTKVSHIRVGLFFCGNNIGLEAARKFYLRIWFAYPTRRSTSSLVNGKVRNIDAKRQNPLVRLFLFFSLYPLIFRFICGKINLPNKSNSLLGVFFLYGIIIPFFGILYISTNLVKMQIPRCRVCKCPYASICLATIGVCVFRCGDFGCRTFCF